MKRIFWIWLCLLVGVGVFAEQVAELNTATAYAVEQIADEGSIGTLYEEFVFTYMPIIPPAPSEMFLQPVGRLIVFDESTFKRRFLSNLIGEMHPVSGAPVYTVFAMMDASNFDVVLFNENLLELARISRPKTYRPFLWAETKFGAALTPELMALYNPARMIAEYKLIPVDYADYHIAALEQQAALEAATVSMATASPAESDGVSIRMAGVPATTVLTENDETLMVMAMASSPPPPSGGGTNSPPAGSGGGSSNLVMELAITMPLDCGPYVEIFQKQNLIYPQLWDVAVNKMAVTGGVETIWADPASSNAATMFYIVGDTSAGIDDGDGYSELRERYVTGTDPTVFNHVDTDGDGLHDWYETMLFGNLSQAGSGDFDGDGLANDQEMILQSNSVEVICNPAEFDTDGDGTDDGTEVAQGGDPSDPSDGGQPPAPPETTPVTLFVQDRSDAYLEGGYTMKLSDGINTYEISSSGLEVVSNTFDVVSGRSYTLTLTSEDFLPYTGAYAATVSGNGLIKDDPENILGVHDDNNTEVDLYPPGKAATVHVVKIKTETVATAPADRTRKTIGVGEAVDLTFLPSGLSPISWVHSGVGGLDKTTGGSVKFTASDVAGSSTITATYAGHDFPVAFTTIEPTGVLFENYSLVDAVVPTEGGDFYFIRYFAQIYVQPDTVNFGNIELYESAAPSEKEGYFEDKNIPDHEANGGHDVDGYEEGKGSSMEDADDIAMSAIGAPYSDGTMTWAIDWSYTVGVGEQKIIERVDQVADLNVGTNKTTFTITKDVSGVYIDTEDEEGMWIE